MLLDIKTVPDPLLRQKCAPVTVFDHHLLATIADMFDTMDSRHGVGLAAPQVGLLQQILVVSYEDRRFALINPTFVSHKGKLYDEEGCLSIPGVRLQVPRFDRIVITAQTPKGKPIRLQERGFVSRIIQHEMDHLIGTLITDYLDIPSIS
jgi:peptide deformylase